ncbi:MAG: tetratricopeptide repeat protein [Turicibacter sp.]|nr:tetratricopeptide repeat protein [Turicibacter sp.]
MSIEYFIEQYEKGQLTEETIEKMQHFAFEANDDEIFIIAQIFAAIAHVSKAIELVEPLLAKYPNEVNLKTFLADLYLDLAEDEKALDLLSGSDEETNASVLLLEADMYIAQGLFEVAEDKLKKAKDLEPHNELIQLAYAEFYHHVGEFEKALDLYLDLIECGLNAEINVYDRLATCYSHIGEFEKALEQFQLSEKYFGQLNTDQLFNKGLLAYQVGNYSLAKQVFHDLKELDPSYDTLYPFLAKIYLKENEDEKALEMIQEGITHNEFNAELYALKGQALERLKDLEGARDAYYEALNLEPEDLEAALRSNRICLVLEDFEEVVRNIQHYTETGLYDDRFDWDLAIAFLELEEYEEAASYFEKSLVNYGENVDFLFDYAQFLIAEGQREQAIKWLEKILTLDASLTPAQELIENLM